MPDFKDIVRERIAPLRLDPATESNLVEELAQHLEDRFHELRSAGYPDQEAARQAASELATSELADLAALRRILPKQHDRIPAGDTRRANLIADAWRDLRFATRSMRQNPMFVIIVVLTLALGIGANTTVFTIVNTLLLNPLPVPDASGLIAIQNTEPRPSGSSTLPISYADLKDYAAKNDAFRSLAGYTTARIVTSQTSGAAERIFCEFVSGNYFDVLGISPARGRFFVPEEDGIPGAHPVAVMNYATWKTRYGGADSIVGATLRLNGIPFTVIGVAPPHFIGVNAIFGPNLWVPAAMTEQLLPNEMRNALTDRGKVAFTGIGRLKAGITRQRAQANLKTIASALAAQYPETNEGHSIIVQPVRDVVFGSAMTGTSGIMFAGIVLLVVVAIVLLIACSNVANLLLARSAARQQEIAVRLAIGASRGRLVRQLLTESVFLAVLSGAAGVLLAYESLQFLWSFLPSAANFITPKLDSSVLLFAVAVSVATGFLFGAAPALEASRAAVAEALKQQARSVGSNRSRINLANILLIGQVAFSFALLTTAGLFLRSIARAYNIDPGFQTAHLAVFMTNPGQDGLNKAQAKQFYKDVRNRVGALPTVQSVAWASNLPLWARKVTGLEIEGRAHRSQAEKITTIANTVEPGYFATAGVALDHGRDFTPADRDTSIPVAIVNEKLAHDISPTGAALGKRIQLPGETQWRQIVGIARNANYSNWAEPPQPCVYIPLEQNFADSMTLYVRSKGDPRRILGDVQREIRSAGPRILITSVRTGSEIIDNGLFQARMGVGLLSAFGLLALTLASIGLYGIVAYGVSRRKREIGVRMALGARQTSVVALVVREGMSLVLTGVAIGLALALIAGRFLGRLLYGVSAADPLSLAGAIAILCAVALLACYLPARRASRVDPMLALRES